MSELKCSVVMATFCQDVLLRQTLNSLYNQSLPQDQYEVLVVDNNADPDWRNRTRAIVESFPAVYLEESTPGAGAARNTGVNNARSELIIFTDDDVEAERSFLDEHLKAHSDRDNLVVVGAIAEEAKTVGWFRRYLLDYQVLNKVLLPDAAVDFRQFYGANSSVRKKWILEVGGFDPDFRRRQDGELGYRLMMRGLKFKAAPNAKVLHHSKFQPEAYLKRARDNGYYLALFCRKHPEIKDGENYGQYKGLKVLLARLVGLPLYLIGRLLYPFFPYLLYKGFTARLLVQNARGIRDLEQATPER